MIVCLSEYYPIKDWTRFELEVGKRAAGKRLAEYLLPLHLTSTPPPIAGLRETIGYQRLMETSDIARVIDLMQKKLQSAPVAQHHDTADGSENGA